MSLTPDEVEHKQFTVALRGFDQREVVEFLRTVAADYRRAIEVIESGSAAARSAGASRPLGRLVPGVDASSDDFQAVGDQVAEVLRAAADAAAAIRSQARQEAEDMIMAAGADADRIRGEAELTGARAVAELAERQREAEDRAADIVAAAERQARALIDQAHARVERLTQGEHDVAARLRTAVTAVDRILAEVDAGSLVAP